MMASSSQDPEVGQGGAGGSSSAAYDGNDQLQRAQAQVNEVVDIMRKNVDKVIERDQKLTDLDHRADALRDGASQFERGARQMKQKQWWANMKMTIIIGILVTVLVIILIFSFLPSDKK